MKKNRTISLLVILILFSSCKKNASQVHSDAFVVDTHNDVLLRSLIGRDILTDLPESHSDLPKFKEGGVDCQVFSIWVSPYEYGEGEYFKRANEMITRLENLCSIVPEEWAIPFNYQDLIYNDQRGILSCMIGVEGGHAIENDLKKLDALYNRGMRYLGITWNNSTDWATSAKDETQKGDSLAFIGLTDFGRKVVNRCNKLGIMIDVSHSGEQTFYDIIETTSKPIIASHSSVYSICPHFRNLKDNQLFALKKNGGVAFVNFYPGYIDSTYSGKAESEKVPFKSQLDSLAKLYDTDGDMYWYKENEILNSVLSKIVPDVDQVIDHIDYIAKLIGVDHVGIGADWDGVEILPSGIETITKMPIITEKLLDRGYSERDVKKILGGNFKRVYREVTG
ncbi:MAG: membrane dipeptidase [Candidatus Marinimicrobia bacterium]|jgi:membrane dipeptidase|nr:membrane dipeptidase [Candidatus Neomarinimicrobiota bacterium]MBT4579441.1 membrane dipeptidase [Candidatus Neomarinimicrobiota bacterium]MBT4957392.1 membrane dipeptidase [Candidatus Neomarinimicrobiota bacterium]MBT5759151.1 membrane dipeptidase [Candidatus Neomarinimicrobiota bacterium]MBT7113182.1 membrane dipeptidase [Candidatus Neomarinimicrobiota bacterium]